MGTRVLSRSTPVREGSVKLTRGARVLLFHDPSRQSLEVRGPAVATLGRKGWAVVPPRAARSVDVADWGRLAGSGHIAGTTVRGSSDTINWIGPCGRVPTGILGVRWKGEFTDPNQFNAFVVEIAKGERGADPNDPGEPPFYKRDVPTLSARSHLVPEGILRPASTYELRVSSLRDIYGTPTPRCTQRWIVETPSPGVCAVLRAARSMAPADRAALYRSAGCEWAAAEILQSLPGRSAEADLVFRNGAVAKADGE